MAQARVDVMKEVNNYLLDSAKGHQILANFPQMADQRIRFSEYAAYRYKTAEIIRQVGISHWGMRFPTIGQGGGLCAYVSMLESDRDSITIDKLISTAIEGETYLVKKLTDITLSGELGEIGDPSKNRRGNSYDFINAVLQNLKCHLEEMKYILDQVSSKENPSNEIKLENEDAIDEGSIEVFIEEMKIHEDITSPEIDNAPEDQGIFDASKEAESNQKTEINTASIDYVSAVMPPRVQFSDSIEKPSKNTENDIDPQEAVFETDLTSDGRKKEGEESEEGQKKPRILILKRPVTS